MPPRVVAVVCGFAAGVVCTALVVWLVGGSQAGDSTAPGAPAGSSTEVAGAAYPEDGAAPGATGHASAPDESAASAFLSAESEAEPGTAESQELGPFPAGTVMLRIGDEYRFGSAHHHTSDVSVPDIACYDLPAGRCVLGTFFGSEAVFHPRIIVGETPKQADAFLGLVDAPSDLSDAEEVTLSVNVRSGERTGIALVRAHDNKVYKVRIVSEERSVQALDRFVVLAYEVVRQARDGGGVRVTPHTVTGIDASEGVYRALQSLRKLAGQLPGRSSHLRVNKGQLIHLEYPPQDLVVTKDRHIVIGTPILGSVRLDRGGLLYADAGVAPSGTITYSRNAGVVVVGGMAGRINADSNGSIYVDGSVSGTIATKRQTTVVVLGDLSGTLEISGRSTVVVRGRLLRDDGWLKIDRRGSGDIYLEGYYTADRIATFPGKRGVTLHVEQSDLRAGRHSGRAGFRNVYVAERVWAKFPPE